MTMPRKISRILVPIDFSETSGAALDYATFLAKTFSSSVELLHVLDPMLRVAGESVMVAGKPESLIDHAWRIAEEELARLATRLERDGIVARAKVDSGVPWERVVSAGERADIIVMGTHGRTGLSRVFLGSVTDRVVQRSVTPVLTIRGAAPERVLDTVAVTTPETA